MIPFSREREREIGFLDSSLRKQRETERNERERDERGEFKRGRHASECLSFDVRTA